MNEDTLNYINMIHIIKSWFIDNIIDEKDFIKIESYLAKKYGIKNNNIYRTKQLDKSFL